MSIAIRIKNVNKNFGETTVLSNINIEFEQGKVHGLIGRNGSGKTMLMKCICGLVPVSSGQIMIASHSSEDIEVLCDTICEMEKGKLSVIR